MKQISLTQGYITFIDNDDFTEVSKHKWCYHGGYAVRGIRQGNKTRLVRLHQQLMGFPGMPIDHINQNKLDNRRTNLRMATKAQNLMNRGPNKNNTSGYKGVSHVHSSSRLKTKQWKAQIVVSRKLKPLGYFSTPELAAMAYNAAALKYHGEFAYQNRLAV